MTFGMPDVVMVDTSCLIALPRINQLSLLQRVYKKISIIREIKHEFKLELPERVDAGEASVIKSCLASKNSLLIIDDGKGRKLAKRLGIRVSGTLALLVKAKEKGLINTVKSC